MPESQGMAGVVEFLRPTEDLGQIPDAPDLDGGRTIDAIRLELIGAASDVVTLCEYVRIDGLTYLGAQVLSHNGREWETDLPSSTGLQGLTVRHAGHLHAIADMAGVLTAVEMRGGDHLVWELGAGWRFESAVDGVARVESVRRSLAQAWTEVSAPVGAL